MRSVPSGCVGEGSGAEAKQGLAEDSLLWPEDCGGSAGTGTADVQSMPSKGGSRGNADLC